MKIEKRSPAITSLRDWEKHAGPKKQGQWKEGRSAHECAAAWLRNGEPGLPMELKKLLDSCDDTRSMEVELVHPELQIRFDDYAGEPRNADMAFVGSAGQKKIAVTIEAKADESFGRTLAKEIISAEKTLAENPRSNKKRRIDGLLEGILGLDTCSPETVAKLRYQLLTAAAGTLAYAQAERADLAVLIVHVFRTKKTTDAKIEKNNKDYEAFLQSLKAVDTDAGTCGDFQGPFVLPGGDRYDNPTPLLVGKVETTRPG